MLSTWTEHMKAEVSIHSTQITTLPAKSKKDRCLTQVPISRQRVSIFTKDDKAIRNLRPNKLMSMSNYRKSSFKITDARSSSLLHHPSFSQVQIRPAKNPLSNTLEWNQNLDLWIYKHKILVSSSRVAIGNRPLVSSLITMLTTHSHMTCSQYNASILQ